MGARFSLIKNAAIDAKDVIIKSCVDANLGEYHEDFSFEYKAISIRNKRMVVGNIDVEFIHGELIKVVDYNHDEKYAQYYPEGKEICCNNTVLRRGKIAEGESNMLRREIIDSAIGVVKTFAPAEIAKTVIEQLKIYSEKGGYVALPEKKIINS